MNKSLSRLANKQNIILIFLASVGLLIYSGVVWYNSVYTDETRTFWATMENNLRTSSVTKITEENNPSQNVKQDQDLDFVRELSVSNLVSITSPQSSDVVAVETRGFTDADFLRYTQIELNDDEQQAAVEDGIGVWAKQEVNELTQPELVQESLVSSFILFGNLPSDKRQAVFEGIKRSYTIDSVEEISRDGRAIYQYDVTVELSEYANTLVEYLGSLGYQEFGETIQAQTVEGQQIPIKVLIDKHTRTLVETINDQGGVERYTAQGVSKELERPETDVTYQQLQELLSE